MINDLISSKHQLLEACFFDLGFPDFKWIDVQKIIIAQWVRMKCMFGCYKYGKNCSCPPNVPSIAECQKFFGEYSTAVIFHFQNIAGDGEIRHKWTNHINQQLSKLERAVFLSGFEKAFVLFMNNCKICIECSGVREACKHPAISRPVPEALGIDIFSTVKQFGFPINICTEKMQTMNRYAFLLVE